MDTASKINPVILKLEFVLKDVNQATEEITAKRNVTMDFSVLTVAHHAAIALITIPVII